MSLKSQRIASAISALFFSITGLVILCVIGCVGYVVFLALPLIFLLCMPHDLFGYIDNKAHFVIPPRYVVPGDFKNGHAKVYIEHDNRCSAILPVHIDKQGKILEGKLIEGHYEEYDSCPDSHFPEYYTPSVDSINGEYPKAVSSEGWYGYQNKDGSWLLPPQFSKAGQFNNGVAWVKTQNDNDERWLWGLVDKKGKYVLNPKCESAGDFHEGLAYCRVPVYFGVFY